MLAGHRPEPGRELATVGERLGVPDGRNQRRGGEGADSLAGHDPQGRLMRPCDQGELAIIMIDLGEQGHGALVDLRECLPGQGREVIVGILQELGMAARSR